MSTNTINPRRAFGAAHESRRRARKEHTRRLRSSARRDAIAESIEAAAS